MSVGPFRILDPKLISEEDQEREGREGRGGRGGMGAPAHFKAIALDRTVILCRCPRQRPLQDRVKTTL